MKKTTLFFCCCLSAGILMSQPSEFPDFSGPYLGQKPPGMIPEAFAPELRSTMVGYAFSPDESYLIFKYKKFLLCCGSRGCIINLIFPFNHR